MIPDALDFILRGTDDQQAEYAAAHKPSVTPAPSPCTGVADTDSSDADAVGALASEDLTPAGAFELEPLNSAPRPQVSPRWSAIDDDTADLLSLVASDKSGPWADEEWHRFTQALEAASDLNGRIDPNFLRPLLRGTVAPNRIGAFTNRAKAEGLIAWDGEWITSDDTEGRNSGKPCRVYRWLGAAS